MEIVVIIFFLIFLSCILNSSEKNQKDEEPIEELTVEKRSNSQKKYILMLLAEVMKADYKNLKCELDRVRSTINRYYTTTKEQAEALDEFQTFLNEDNEIKYICYKLDFLTYVDASELVMELLAVAFSDEEYNEKEQEVIDSIVKGLGISWIQYESIYSIFIRKYDRGDYNTNKKSNKKKADKEKKNDNNDNKRESKSTKEKDSQIESSYKILQVKPTASNDEIKKAYRSLAKQYHPDFASAFGDEAIRQATESMKRINEAWESVKEARGIN